MLPRLRIVVLSVMWALVLVAFAMYFVFSDLDGGLDAPPLALLAAPVVVGALVHGVVLAVGYRTEAVPPGTDAEQAMRLSGARFNTTLFLRLALCEAVALGSIVLGIVTEEGGFGIYCLGALVSLALLGWHAWPSERVIGRVQEQLEREGGDSFLREALGLRRPTQGAVQEL